MPHIFWDMDNTLINYPYGEYSSSWGAVFHSAGKFEESQKLLEQYLPNPHLYGEWFDRACSLLKDVPVDDVMKKILPPVYMEGAKDVVRETKKMATIGLLSAGTDPPARYVAKELEMEFCECNELLQENGLFTGIGKCNVSLWDKKQNMVDVCNRFGIKSDEKGIYRGTVVIGDHENELGSFGAAECSIAYRPTSDKVRKAADYVVTDLKQIPQIIRKLF